MRFFKRQKKNSTLEDNTNPDHRHVDIFLSSDQPIFVKSPPQTISRLWVHLLLFILTVLTTVFVGTLLEGANPFFDIRHLWLGVPFSFTLMAILGYHELGHFALSRYHGVRATLPYFIPFPYLPIGTFGAFIKIKSPIYHKKALLDIGAAGPIAGFLVALPAIVWGLQNAEIREAVPAVGQAWILGDSLLLSITEKLVIGNIPEGYDVSLGSVAYAGWIGLLVTAFNLMPIAQLDGGHISYAVLGKFQKQIAQIFIIALIILALYTHWYGWFLWILIGLILRLKHPPTINDAVTLDLKRKIIGIVCLIIFILCFVPIPFSIR